MKLMTSTKLRHNIQTVLVLLIRAEMLPGVDGVTGVWDGVHCLLRDSPGGAEVCTPGPLPWLQRSG